MPGAGGVNVPPTGGSVSVTASCSVVKRNVQLNSNTGSLLEAWLKAPAGMCIVFSPGITGDELKSNSMLRPSPATMLPSAGVPLTVKSLA